jgi:hypothetical protein
VGIGFMRKYHKRKIIADDVFMFYAKNNIPIPKPLLV